MSGTRTAMRSDQPRMRADEEGASRWLAAEIGLPLECPTPILAVGAESKGVFAVAAGRRAWLSTDFGVLTVPEHFRAFQEGTVQAANDLGIRPGLIVRDLHPGYLTTELAQGSGLLQCVVQHHHAHIAACMAENGVSDPVIGICCDGAGCGMDMASWGCELLQADTRSFVRLAHLRYFELPGGDKAASQCWRPALSLVRQAFGTDFPSEAKQRFAHVRPRELRLAEHMLDRNVQCPRTSSLGRLFDAMAFLLGVCESNGHEAEAAMRLQAAAENVAGPATALDVPRLELDGRIVLDFAPAVKSLCERQWAGESTQNLAADFHETVAAMLVREADIACRRTGIRRVALSGGCFLNRLLAVRIREQVADAGLEVIEHSNLSPGDGSLALGQVLVAAARELSTKE